MAGQDAWRIDAGAVMSSGDPAAWRGILSLSTLAPSGHNTQPWLIQADCTDPANVSLLFAGDRRRALPLADPRNRELVLSVAIAAQFARLALEEAGYRPSWEVVIDAGRLEGGEGGGGSPSHPTSALPAHVLPVVRLAFSASAADRHEPRPALMLHAPARRTCNAPFSREEDVPADALRALDDAVARSSSEDARVQLAALRRGEEAHREARELVVALAQEASHKQFAAPGFSAELAAWMRTNFTSAEDGLQGHARGLGNLVSLLAPLVVRWGNVADGEATRAAESLGDAPVVAALCTDGDEPRHWVAAGAAHARLVLQAQASGLHMSYFNQVLQIESTRTQLQQRALAPAAGTCAVAQLLVRVGVCRDDAWLGETRRAPRRPLAAVLSEYPEWR